MKIIIRQAQVDLITKLNNMLTELGPNDKEVIEYLKYEKLKMDNMKNMESLMRMMEEYCPDLGVIEKVTRLYFRAAYIKGAIDQTKGEERELLIDQYNKIREDANILIANAKENDTVIEATKYFTFFSDELFG